jgi:hypothetical protein
LFGTEDFDTARSAAARSAIESVVFAPPSVLPDRGVSWRAETEHIIVARFDLPPEHPRFDSASTTKSHSEPSAPCGGGNAGEKTFGYIPFGGLLHAERRFGDLVLPSSASVGWWFGTPRYEPFFKARISDVSPWEARTSGHPRPMHTRL